MADLRGNEKWLSEMLWIDWVCRMEASRMEVVAENLGKPDCLEGVLLARRVWLLETLVF